MKGSHHSYKEALLVLVLCLWKTDCTGVAAEINREIDSFENGPSYFLFQQFQYPKDCYEASRECSSLNSSGVYVIKPDGYPEPFEVYCYNDVRSGGWLVIQRRIDSMVVFSRLWDDYKGGFGFLSSNYFLGNDKLSYLTNQAVHEIRVDMELSNGSSVYVTYSEFRVSDEWSNYTLLTLRKFADGGVGTMMSCPHNMVYGNCTCTATCEEPDEPSYCHSDCALGTEGCYCPAGFLMDGDECVSPSQCPCFWPDVSRVIPDGESDVNDNCTLKRSCNNNQLVQGEDYRCDDNAQCEVREGIRQCYCDDGYGGNGQTCKVRYEDCYDVYNAGHTQNGVYTILPSTWNGSPFEVLCNMSNGGGWTVFQSRTGRDRGIDFYRDWASYRDGFGSFNGDFWLGNEKLHYLAKQKDYRLRVDMLTSGNSAIYSEYDLFKTAAGSDNYRLTISGHSGNTDNGMDHANGEQFSTYDRDNDNCDAYDCAERHRGAWWYTSTWCYCRFTNPHCNGFRCGSGTYGKTLCTIGNLNGDYNGQNGERINWYHGNNCHLNSVEMKIRPAN